ncbi:MAG: MopE-related protein [bacterium]
MKRNTKKDYQSEFIESIICCISILIIMSLMTAFYKPVAEAVIYYVPGNFSSIQPAITAAVNGDTIIVRNGTYTGANNKNLDFAGKRITVRSENGAQNTIIDCQNSGRGFYFHSGENNLSVLDGFTIKNASSLTGSGAIDCSGASPTIKNCIITDNSSNSLEFGGGGGIGCWASSSPQIINCIISRNSADGAGGGIICNSSSPTITNCTISENTSNGGAGITCHESSSTITGCIIKDNIATYDGGGIDSSSSSLIITNCIIIGNTAGRWGGGMNCLHDSPTLINCTISENTDGTNGGGIYCSYSSPTITNCILWNDSGSEIYKYGYSSNPIVTYSDIQGGYSGTGNINQNPMFVNPDADNYHLQSGSPCIDAGTGSGAPANDIEGNSRPCNEHDMGAYEFIVAIDADGDGHYTPGSCVTPADDCNDSDNTIYLGATEICDGKDNDCDTLIDEGLSTDADGDGHYLPGSCFTPADDCNDSDNTIYPGATEICDGKDNDCDTFIDDGLSTDADGDGHYAPGSCLTPADDCDDNNPSIWDCDTPTGNNVSVQNDTGEVTLTFPVVTGGGNTSITVEDCESPPEGITLAPYSPFCVEITTDATFEGEAQICISYDDTGLTIVQELNLNMVRCDNLGTCQLLACDPPIPVDTAINIVCACTDHFSIFAVGIPTDKDGDLTPDLIDNCPDDYNIWQEDKDEDGIGDVCDNCPDFYDPTNQCQGLQMNLPAGWSMISLNVEPEDPTSSTLFPEATVIYGYQKGSGYDRIEGNEALEPGKGYWILFKNTNEQSELKVAVQF